jgi:hypothetical protein
MGAWLSNISLKYKFWAVNAVAFITTLLLVLYAVQLEQQSRSHAAQASPKPRRNCSVPGRPGSRLPQGEHWLLPFESGPGPRVGGPGPAAQ